MAEGGGGYVWKRGQLAEAMRSLRDTSRECFRLAGRPSMRAGVVPARRCRSARVRLEGLACRCSRGRRIRFDERDPGDGHGLLGCVEDAVGLLCYSRLRGRVRVRYGGGRGWRESRAAAGA